MQEQVRVAVYVSGGLVSAVVSNASVGVHILDADNAESEGYESQQIDGAWEELKKQIGAEETQSSLVAELWPSVAQITGEQPGGLEDDSDGQGQSGTETDANSEGGSPGSG